MLSSIRTVLLFFSIILSIPIQVKAATWEPVRLGPGSSFMELDVDSVRKLSAGDSFTAIWRSGLSQDTPVTIFSGVVNCELESIFVEKQVYVDGSGQPGIFNYAENNYERGGYKRGLSEIEKRQGLIYPVSTSKNGLLIANVCQRLNNLAAPKNDALESLREKIGCGTGVQSFICKGDVVSHALVRSLLLRMGQAEIVCETETKQMWKLAEKWLNEATASCKNDDPGCGKYGLEISIEGVGGDLARQAHGDSSCAFLQASLRSMASENKKRMSVNDFKQCAAVSVVKLDDGKTSADVVAQAVFAKCQINLHADLFNSKVFKDAVMPRLIGDVLENRISQVKPGRQPVAPKVKSKSNGLNV